MSGDSSFWTLDFWSNITNLIGVVILGMAVPIGKWLVDRRTRILTENRKKEDERIASIVKQNIDPIMTKLNDISGKVNYMDEIVKKNIRFGSGGNNDGAPDDIDGRDRGGGSGSNRNRPRGRRYDPFINEEGGGGDSNNPFGNMR